MIQKAVLREYLTREILSGGADSQLEEDDDLIESGVLDSLALVQLISFIEKRFGIGVLPHEVTREHFGSLERMARYLEVRGGRS